MYKLTCDGYPLLDLRDEEMILVNPKVKLEVNTVGEGSFTIHKDHPYYGKLKKLKSIFEVSDEVGVIFRGRMTGNTIEFDNEKNVDLEGVMAFFNDSIIRPFSFPEDFLQNEGYIAAAEGGNVVAFFLEWLIGQHNSQVQDFQKLHLGDVTVSDPNNYISRSSEDYASTWETLKNKLFDSSLGGYLCARYEADGTYIDYLKSFELVNTQQIIYGENLLDLSSETDASVTYSAITPLGKDKLTIEELPDGNISEDIVKIGDTLYSRSAVESYGWIYAPARKTTWDDVTIAGNLQNNGVEWLVTQGVRLSNTIEVTAVDLHFTDEEIRSFRIYRGIQVVSAVHGFEATYPLTRLHLDLLNPQNTKITVGTTELTFTEKQENDTAQKIESATNKLQEEVSSKFESINQTVIEKTTTVMNDCEKIIMTALERYVETSNYEEFRSTVSSEFAVLAGQISMNFTTVTEQIKNVGEDAQSKLSEISKHLSFGADGITIGSSENAIKMNLDNDQLVFSKNGVEIIRVDIDNSIFTNVWIKAGGRLRLGNFGWDVHDNGVPVFAKVGG